MSILQNSNAISAPAGGNFYTHQIANSCRFNRANVSKMSRALGTPSDTKKFTFSSWVKLGTLSTATNDKRSIFGGSGSTNSLSLGIENGQLIYIDYPTSGGSNTGGIETLVYLKRQSRDTSAWQHIVINNDTTQAVAANRVKFYINGELQTVFDTHSAGGVSTPFYPAEDSVTINASSHTFIIGTSDAENVANSWDGYQAETYFIDGTAYAGSDFGETKNGVWIPKDASGLTFGNNGFYLKYTNSSALGEDFSGNDNDYTVSNISAHDQMLDSPTFNSDSNGGNFATLGPLWGQNSSSLTLSEGNLRGTMSANNIGTMSNWAVPDGGKWYWEVNYSQQANTSSNIYTGIAYANTSLTAGETADQVVYYTENGMKIIESTRSSYGTAFDSPSGDAVVGVAVDRVNDTLNFSYNGSWQGTFDISGLSNNEFFPFTMPSGSSSTQGITYNFGQDGTFAGKFTAQGNADDTGYGNFKYDVPAGFLALCSGNLPVADAIDPAQTDDNYPQKLFSPILYTGNGGTNNITGLGFKPDWLFIKIRNTASNAVTVDSTRGTNKVLFPTNTDAEQTSANVTAFGTDGFSLAGGLASYDPNFNGNSNTYVAWAWRANGGTTSTNDSGSVDSTVQADPSGAFSIVTWAGSGGAATIGHGLSGAPSFMVAKSRTSSATVEDWVAFHKNMNNGAFPANESRMYWNSTGGYSTGALWQTDNNSATVFGVTSNISNSSKNYVAYCFTDVEGYIKAGSYVGNANADGTFVYTGFKPAWIMIKKTNSTSNWNIFDTTRDPFNYTSKHLTTDSHAQEYNGVAYSLDILSNGFKLRATWTSINNGNFIYLAFAENPFKYATAR